MNGISRDVFLQMFENEHFGLNFPYAAFRLRTASYPSAGAKKSVQVPKGVRPRTERKVEKRLSYFFLFVYKMEIIIFGMSLSARVDALKGYRANVKNIAMLRRLLLLIMSFVAMNAFAQMPLKISISQKGDLVIIAPKNENEVWTKIRNGRKEAWYEPCDDHRSYWTKTLNGIRRKYITDEEFSELRKKKILLDLSLCVDDKGHVFFVRMMGSKGILDVLSKRRLTNMYKEFLGLTVPLPVELDSSQYVNMRVSYI